MRSLARMTAAAVIATFIAGPVLAQDEAVTTEPVTPDTAVTQPATDAKAAPVKTEKQAKKKTKIKGKIKIKKHKKEKSAEGISVGQ